MAKFKYYLVIHSNTMETVTIKLDEGLLKEIDETLAKRRYSTRTEFIREAIRNRIKDLEKEESLARVRKYYGASKRKTTDKQLHKARERIAKELEKEFK